MGLNMKKIWRDVDKDIKRQKEKMADELDARAAAGDVAAIAEVANQYMHGLCGRKQSDKKAFEFWGKGVALGDAKCAMNYANQLVLGLQNNVMLGRDPYYNYTGKKVDDKTKDKVFALYQLAAEKGDVFAMEIMASLEKVPAKREAWADKAAENGAWRMQLEKVKQYEKKNEKQCFVWLKKLLDNRCKL